MQKNNTVRLILLDSLPDFVSQGGSLRIAMTVTGVGLFKSDKISLT